MLVVAKKRGLVLAVTPLLDELLMNGFRMSKELYRSTRKLAGEE
jgi:predicted nucleic acid-binding protein